MQYNCHVSISLVASEIANIIIHRYYTRIQRRIKRSTRRLASSRCESHVMTDRDRSRSTFEDRSGTQDRIVDRRPAGVIEFGSDAAMRNW
jgi:hypothetical protein